MTEQQQVEALAKREAFVNSVVRAGGLKGEWSIERLETVKKMAAPEAKSVHELAAFLSFAERYGLDPIKHLWMIDTGRGRLQIEVSRDGWIRILNRQPDYMGMDNGVVRKGEDFEVVRDREGVYVKHSTTAATASSQIVLAYCVIHRRGHRPTVVTLPFSEMSTRGPVWKAQPGVMALTRAIAFAAKTAYGIEAYAEGELRDQPLLEEEVQANAAEATRQKLEALKAPETAVEVDTPSDTHQEADEAPAAAQEPLDAEIVDEEPQDAPEADWKAARDVVLAAFADSDLSGDQISATWESVFDCPMDGRFESAREVWLSLAKDSDQREEFINYARTDAQQQVGTHEAGDGLFD